MRRNDDIGNIVKEHSSGLYSYIRRHVHSQEDAEDILQEVFYLLSRHEEQIDSGIECISAWLYRVARNMILNFWRKKREVTLSSILYGGEDYICDDISKVLFGGDADAPDRVYLRKLVWQELDMALSQLPPEQREIFCLTVFDALPVKDIARSTGTPVATLLSRKHYAVKFLRRRFHELYAALIIRE